MPPLSAYTSFESLLFFQSLATSDSRPTSFGTISTLLRNNQLVRENVDFDADRLTPEALEDLYATLMRDGFSRDSAPSVNGRPSDTSSPPNPKKRKISSPRPDGLTGFTHATLVPELVAHLYAKYRDLVTREIRDDEKKYTEIRAELERLQQEDAKSAAAAATAPTPVKPVPIEVKDAGLKEETLHPHVQDPTGQPLATTVPLAQDKAKPEPQHIATNVPPTTNVPPKTHVPPVTQTQAPIPQSQTPTPNPQDVAGQAPQPQPTTQPLPKPSIQPPLAPAIQKAPPTTPAGPRVTPAHPSQIAPRANPVQPAPIATGKAGPLAPASQRTPAQPSFQQWQLDPSPHSPYPAVSPGAATPQVAQATTKRPVPLSVNPPLPGPQAQTPLQPLVPQTPSAIPSTTHTPVPIGRPRVSQTPSATFPSFSESRGSHPRLSIDTQGSSTPWKRTPRPRVSVSPSSPPRPRPEDVSPISERGDSPIDAMEMSPPPRINLGQRAPSTEDKKPRRGQADTKPAPIIKTEKLASIRRTRAVSSGSSRSRGRSMASRDGSVAPSEDTVRESRATGRRKGAAATADEETPKPRIKRKRGASEALEIEPHPADIPRFDTTQYVMATRNFHRTAAPIMNDVATHKLASIFAKPISERDAPGYHDLIYRPSDLKSIKSAIHQGSKAVATAGESASTPAGDGESPVPGGTPSKGGILMLQKSEDFVPPKGIVNSAQLEKELIRMFANAIMFNPIPQRGFGPAFPMSSDRGSRESTQLGDSDEGGIIQDSLEMFEDVQQAVTRWRAAERTADELANKNVLSLRRGSASDFNTDSTDDVKG
ncbi:Bromodomain [Penicillium concentricum]|uniref:Bromodomain n=1 Tax=Penicillium concentricum TaxID=293559 RepID=A0A9W9SBW0_9EURO|nr:Bromodomain [Penicillium concentricum]KAJ5375783.1 Bromodomain [Penicillium concentricum]